jgi:hypothetical protein
MPIDPADATRAERRRRLTGAELRAREQLQSSRLGRLGRLRSWLTALLAIIAVGACLLALRHTA